MQDWPDCDEHFSLGVQRLSRVQVGEPRHLRITDPRLFDHPWIYATQTGYWDFSDRRKSASSASTSCVAASS